MFATFGWMLGSKLNSLMQRRKHTLDVLIMIKKEENRKLFNAVLKHYPLNKRPNMPAYPKARAELRGNLLSLLNMLEMIAMSCRFKELDKTLIENSLKGMIIAYYKNFLPTIREFQNKSANEIFEENKTYNWLKWLVEMAGRG